MPNITNTRQVWGRQQGMRTAHSVAGIALPNPVRDHFPELGLDAAHRESRDGECEQVRPNLEGTIK